MPDNDVIIDHVSVYVSDYEKAKRFYTEALRPIGVEVLMEFPAGGGMAAGFGKGKPILWISEAGQTKPRVHVAFTAASRAEVDAFYAAALEAGGEDNGPPGLRPHYHANYYAAFVLDPDGHNIEVVSHGG